MGWSIKYQMDYAARIGEATALSMFHLFHSDPKRNQGPNFKWENFGEICRSMAETQVAIDMPGKKARPEMEKHGADTAYRIAERLAYLFYGVNQDKKRPKIKSVKASAAAPKKPAKASAVSSPIVNPKKPVCNCGGEDPWDPEYNLHLLSCPAA